MRLGLSLIAAAAVAVALFLVLSSPHGGEGGAAAPPQPQRAACTRTIPAGTKLAGPLAKAAPGAVLCLRGGSYPGAVIPAAATDWSSWVTLQPAPGQSPTIAGELAFEGARHLRLVGLALRGGLRFAPAAAHLELIGNDLSGAAGIFFFGDSSAGGSISSVLIRGNRIHDIDYAGPQGVYRGYGIKSIGAQHGFTVRANTIESVAADYLQTDEANDWTVDGNTFLGPTLVGGHPQEHQDLWQVYAGGEDLEFTDNVARDTGTSQSLLFQLSYPSNRFRDVVVANNLFDHDSRGYSCQLYQSAGLRFRDNTVVGSRFGCAFRRDSRYPDGSGYEVDHNVFADTDDGADLGVENGVLGWGDFDYNVSSDRSATGRQSLRNWKPAWANTVEYQPLGLPFAAGYAPTDTGLASSGAGAGSATGSSTEAAQVQIAAMKRKR